MFCRTHVFSPNMSTTRKTSLFTSSSSTSSGQSIPEGFRDALSKCFTPEKLQRKITTFTTAYPHLHPTLPPTTPTTTTTNRKCPQCSMARLVASPAVQTAGGPWIIFGRERQRQPGSSTEPRASSLESREWRVTNGAALFGGPGCRHTYVIPTVVESWRMP